eukprot:g49790.t1
MGRLRERSGMWNIEWNITVEQAASASGPAGPAPVTSRLLQALVYFCLHGEGRELVLNRGPITFAQIEACDQQLLGYDILAFTNELRDAFSTGFIPLLKARINIAPLGREVFATATPASATAAAAPAASPNSPAPQLQAASGGGGQVSQGQLDALKAVELDVETLANISDEVSMMLAKVSMRV